MARRGVNVDSLPFATPAFGFERVEGLCGGNGGKNVVIAVARREAKPELVVQGVSFDRDILEEVVVAESLGQFRLVDVDTVFCLENKYVLVCFGIEWERGDKGLGSRSAAVTE